MWADLFNLGPELCRVIHMAQMAEFVDQHVVRLLGRQQHQARIQADIAAAAATAPAGFL